MNILVTLMSGQLLAKNSSFMIFSLLLFTNHFPLLVRIKSIKLGETRERRKEEKKKNENLESEYQD